VSAALYFGNSWEYSLDWTYETIILPMGAKPSLFRKKEQIYKPYKTKFVYDELSLPSFGNVGKVRFERNAVRTMMGSFTANTEEMREE
jgi:hypothetical protein